MNNVRFGATHFFYLPKLTPKLRQKLDELAQSDPMTTSRTVGSVRVLETNDPWYVSIDYKLVDFAQKAFAKFRHQAPHVYGGKLPHINYHDQYRREYGMGTLAVNSRNITQAHAQKFVENIVPPAVAERVRERKLPGALGDLIPTEYSEQVLSSDSQQMVPGIGLGIQSFPGFHMSVTQFRLSREEENLFAERLEYEASNLQRLYRQKPASANTEENPEVKLFGDGLRQGMAEGHPLVNKQDDFSNLGLETNDGNAFTIPAFRVPSEPKEIHFHLTEKDESPWEKRTNEKEHISLLA